MMKNISKKASQINYKKIFLAGMIFIIALFSINLALAFEFDNVKDYDAETKTMTITNALGLGDDIAKITLNTPQINYVMRGKDRLVAEFTINNLKDYNEGVFDNMEFFDINNNMKSFERTFTYKKKIITIIDSVTSRRECEDELALTKCSDIPIIDKAESITWEEISKEELTMFKENITIGVFTNVEPDESIEWIPTLYGIRINEWSSWTEALAVGLTRYWTMNDSSPSTTAKDTMGADNLEVSNNWTVGLINNSFKYTADVGAEGYPQTGSPWNTLNNSNGDMTVVFWLNKTGLWAQPGTDDRDFISQYGDGGQFGDWNFQTIDSNLAVRMQINDGVAKTSDNVPIPVKTGSPFGANWFMVSIRFNSTTARIQINATDHGQELFDISAWNQNGANWVFLCRPGANCLRNGQIDEWGIWNRTLSDAEITQLYNDGNGLTPSTSNSLTVINSIPANGTNMTSSSVIFGCNATGGPGTNITSIVLNGSGTSSGAWTQTISGLNQKNYNATFTNTTLADGNYTWNCLAYGDTANDTSDFWNFRIDATFPQINATIMTPIAYSDGANVTVNYTIFDTNLQACWYNYNNTNTTFACLNGANNITNVTSHYPATIIVIYANDSFGNQNRSSNLSFIFDTSTPNITINSGNGTQNYGILLTNHTLNYTILDTNLQACWLDYNSTNRTIPCTSGMANTTNFTLQINIYNATIYANDSLGNINYRFFSWNYKIFEFNQTFTSVVAEGDLTNFSASVIVGSSYDISSAVFVYNKTSYSATVTDFSNYSLITKNNFVVPEVPASVNQTFYWALTLDDSTVLNLSSHNQSVYNISLQNCTTFSFRLLNLSIVDEELQTLIDNSTVEIAINLTTLDKSTTLVHLGFEYNDENPVAVCSNVNLTGKSYFMEAVIKYLADGYAIEYYNIETFIIEEQRITLYDLNSSDSTDFKLTFTGTDFLPSAGVLVFVERQYISEEDFKTVELPKTDTNGQTILHLVRNDVLYNLIFVKDGEVLRTFYNLRAFCDDFSIGDCKINLNALSSGDSVLNYTGEIGIVFDNPPTYNDTTKKVSFTFLSYDGTSKNVTIGVERRDIFGNVSVCRNSLDSISGTVSCNVGSDITDATLQVTIEVDEVPLIISFVTIDDSAYGNFGYVAWFFLALGLILMFSKDKNGVLIAIVLSYAGAFSLGWIVGGLIGLGTAGIWIIIMTVIGLWRLNKNKPD